MRKSRVILAASLATVLGLAGCATTTETTETATPTETAAAQICGATFDELVTAAKAEGKVDLIALPDSWANYAGVIAKYEELYGIDAVVQNPDASSADELTAIETLRGQDGMPEVVDVGPSFTTQMIEAGYAEAFKPTVWDEIPASLKDADGYWVGSYYGLMGIGTNTTLVPNAPKTFADLLKPEYKGMVTLNGDPREAGAAFAAVMAASLANGGSFDDIMPGIEYFANLKELGNLNTVDITPATLLSGEVSIALDWTYNFPYITPQLEEAGFDFAVNVPSDGAYASYYAQSVVTEIQHPCAARLWLEHLVSNDGALEYIKGGAIPARYSAMLESGVVPAELAATLPNAEVIDAIEFPSQTQVDAAKAALTESWGPMVADN